MLYKQVRHAWALALFLLSFHSSPSFASPSYNRRFVCYPHPHTLIMLACACSWTGVFACSCMHACALGVVHPCPSTPPRRSIPLLIRHPPSFSHLRVGNHTGLPTGAALDMTTTKTKATTTKRQPHYCGNRVVVVVIQDEGTGRGRGKGERRRR